MTAKEQEEALKRSAACEDEAEAKGLGLNLYARKASAMYRETGGSLEGLASGIGEEAVATEQEDGTVAVRAVGGGVSGGPRIELSKKDKKKLEKRAKKAAKKERKKEKKSERKEKRRKEKARRRRSSSSSSSSSSS